MEKTRFDFPKLDAQTRTLMVSEIMLAVRSGNLHFGTSFNSSGFVGWVQWLTVAAMKHDPHWLAKRLETIGVMKSPEKAVSNHDPDDSNGQPDSFAETLSYSQFNRFYMAAICRRALENNVFRVKACRVVSREGGSPNAEHLIPSEYDAGMLLEDLRNKTIALKCNLLSLEVGLSIDYDADVVQTDTTPAPQRRFRISTPAMNQGQRESKPH